MDVARRERGAAPDTVTFLSGDVHNSYLAELADPHRHGATSGWCRPCAHRSATRCRVGVRAVMSLFAKSLVRPMRFVASRSRRVPDPAYPWTVTDGPWFDNNLALVTVGRTRCVCRGSPASSTPSRPPAARAGVRGAARGAARRRDRSGSVQGSPRGGTPRTSPSVGGQGAVPGAASSRPAQPVRRPSPRRTTMTLADATDRGTGSASPRPGSRD
jgi:hypothetical protein